MATYKKDLEQIKTVADKLLADNACYERLVSCGIKIDFISGGPISVGRFRNIVRDINPMNELK